MTENNTENNIEAPKKDFTDASEVVKSPRIIGGLILLCFLAGIGGGLFGALDLAQRPGVQKFFKSDSSSPNGLSGNFVLKEESAITGVVKNTGGAVVSILIFKEVQITPSFGFDPFGFFSNNNSPQSGGVQQVGAGTGFFVSEDGLILTNKHVVSDEGASYEVVTNDGKSYEAKVLSRDPVNDLAIVKVEIQDAKYLSFADSTNVELGQHVVAIGNSLGQYQNTVTSGIVSGIGRSIVAGDRTGSEQLEGVIQTDAAINPGNSGGPLLNLAGQVIGINTAIDQGGQSVGFAIPSNDAKVALDSYKTNGKIVRPYLGVRYVTITEALAKKENLSVKSGAWVIQGTRSVDVAVLPGSPAEKGGIKANDIILSIEGVAISETNTLSKILKAFQAGETVSVVILREGKEQTLSVTLGEAQ